MKVTFLTVGKPARGWSAEAVSHYTRFLSKYTQVAVAHVKAASGRNASDEDVCRTDSQRLLQRLDGMPGAVVVCDGRGESFKSERLAPAWRQLLDTHGGHAIVVVGGACGVDDMVLKRSDLTVSFGPMTLPHDIALIVAMEQVARAFSITRGESYHK